jgi:hypothetical protein
LHSGEQRLAEARSNVRFGSKADMTALHWDVCFAPESGHQSANRECPLSAISRHPVGIVTLAGFAIKLRQFHASRRSNIKPLEGTIRDQSCVLRVNVTKPRSSVNRCGHDHLACKFSINVTVPV